MAGFQPLAAGEKLIPDRNSATVQAFASAFWWQFVSVFASCNTFALRFHPEPS